MFEPVETHGDFRDLDVWKECRRIRVRIGDLAKTFPRDEKFRLADQLIRASRSSTACIAEGYGRYHYQESIQFCRHARGSLYEMIDHITVALDCGYIESSIGEELETQIKSAIRMLNGYIKYLKRRKDNDSS